LVSKRAENLVSNYRLCLRQAFTILSSVFLGRHVHAGSRLLAGGSGCKIDLLCSSILFPVLAAPLNSPESSRLLQLALIPQNSAVLLPR
ncbi:MAG: hypothetical protein WBE42_14170, partial [Pseudolabrys sp.]